MAKRSAKVIRAWIIQYESAFHEILIAIVRNEESAQEFAEFRASAKRLTEQELHVVARYASEYFVARANPSPGKLSEEEIAVLMRQAIRGALARRAQEE